MTTRKRPLRMAVVGQGHFAQVAVLPGIDQLKDVEIAALVSDHPHKLEELGERYRVAHRVGYADYDALVDSGDIDAVYIALPPDLHADYAIRALRRGVHVLCEKPMAPTEEECLAMIAAAEESGAKLMIAYRLHFEPGNLAAVEMIKKGELGEPRVFDSLFSMQVRDGNIRVQPRDGAGPLFDIGIYCVNAARYLFREEPDQVVATRLDNPSDPRFQHVPEAFAVSLRFPAGQVASFVCSFGASDCSWYQVAGTEARLELDNAYEYVSGKTLTVVRDGKRRNKTFRRRDQIAAEVAYFAQCVRTGAEPEPSGYEGLADVRILLAIQRSAESGHAVVVEPVRRDRRPDRGQEVSVAPHGKPELVDVEAASE